MAPIALDHVEKVYSGGEGGPAAGGAGPGNYRVGSSFRLRECGSGLWPQSVVNYPEAAASVAAWAGDHAVLVARPSYRQPSAGATWVRMVSMTWAL
jgi:hypothetical protein